MSLFTKHYVSITKPVAFSPLGPLLKGPYTQILKIKKTFKRNIFFLHSLVTLSQLKGAKNANFQKSLNVPYNAKNEVCKSIGISKRALKGPNIKISNN